MLRDVFIYTLSDKTGVRYVGQSVDPHLRLVHHLCDSLGGRDKTPKGQWIRELDQTGVKPVMDIVECCPTYNKANEQERYWTQHYHNAGHVLLNGTYKFLAPTHKQNTVKVGDSFAAVRHYPGGEYEMLPVATVTEATPSAIVITLADGGSIRLAR